MTLKAQYLKEIGDTGKFPATGFQMFINEYIDWLETRIPRWIPITECVPDEPFDLIATDGNLIFEARFIGVIDGDEYVWEYLDGDLDGELVIVTVTHWMSKDDLRKLL